MFLSFFLRSHPALQRIVPFREKQFSMQCGINYAPTSSSGTSTYKAIKRSFYYYLFLFFVSSHSFSTPDSALPPFLSSLLRVSFLSQPRFPRALNTIHWLGSVALHFDDAPPWRIFAVFFLENFFPAFFSQLICSSARRWDSLARIRNYNCHFFVFVTHARVLAGFVETNIIRKR